MKKLVIDQVIHNVVILKVETNNLIILIFIVTASCLLIMKKINIS